MLFCYPFNLDRQRFPPWSWLLVLPLLCLASLIHHVVLIHPQPLSLQLSDLAAIALPHLGQAFWPRFILTAFFFAIINLSLLFVGWGVEGVKKGVLLVGLVWEGRGVLCLIGK